jgi:Ribonuclease G/E
MSELGEKSVVTLAEIINPEEEEIDILETKDNTEISRKYTVEEEIQGLKEIISYLNDKNQFKKALIYQRRLVKLAREENIKAHEDIDLKQRTLSDF